MGSSQKPEYTGLEKYPGWLATVITIVIGAIFLGALSTNFHHDESHGEAHEAEPATDEAQAE
jgi:hypothetical protein